MTSFSPRNEANMSSRGSSRSVHEDLRDERIPSCQQWTCEQVGKWIEELGFPQYKDCFVSNLIDGKKLILISASALPKIGITDFEHIKFISGSIRQLLTIEHPNWSRSISLPPRETLGMYLERKSKTGEKADELTYKRFLMNFEDYKWQPPLSNHCLILPHS
ncbi:sterile alpha motif domain-containing protein 15-like [Lingula anatina]|uniref:Sterile alpha motif domain-containing protein 15-like n=1 Tax=Lingula anatina TaxID=7574 RepID=A0A1S3K6N1_LINAN|nr:sterile alpha motif domain-containing protein 15-like [Lingula anatina]|eukprot:XP_013418295.1 sterile alpha motif domain-containing protein 15-like [Lingula anatina]